MTLRGGGLLRSRHSYSEAQKVGNTFCNSMFAVTLFMYSGVLSSMGFIPTLFTVWVAGCCAAGAPMISTITIIISIITTIIL